MDIEYEDDHKVLGFFYLLTAVVFLYRCRISNFSSTHIQGPVVQKTG